MLQEIIANKVKSQIKNAMAPIPDRVQEAREQLFRPATFTAQLGVRTMVYNALARVILGPIRTTVLREIIDKHVEKYFNACKGTEALGKKLLPNDELLAPKA